jgi:hypothetical protein
VQPGRSHHFTGYGRYDQGGEERIGDGGSSRQAIKVVVITTTALVR